MNDDTTTKDKAAPNHSSSPSPAKDDATLAKETLESTSSALFESSYSSLHQIIRENVSKLPFLDGSNNSSTYSNDDENNTKTKNNESSEEKMYRVISNVYDKFMDSAQLYAEHELFTIDERKFSKKKRDRLLTAFKKELDRRKLNDKDDDQNGESGKENSIKSSMSKNAENKVAESHQEGQQTQSSSSVNKSSDLPTSMQDIPSPDQIKQLDEEITNLRQKLHQIKVQNTNLETQLKSINQAKDLSKQVNQVVQSSLGSYNNSGNKDKNDKLQDALNAAMIGKNGLEESCQDGREIIHKLNEIKTARNNNEDEDGVNKQTCRSTNETKEFSDETKRAFDAARERKEMDIRPQKKLTLEEDYQERLKSGFTMKNGSTKISSNLLKR